MLPVRCNHWAERRASLDCPSRHETRCWRRRGGYAGNVVAKRPGSLTCEPKRGSYRCGHFRGHLPSNNQQERALHQGHSIVLTTTSLVDLLDVRMFRSGPVSVPDTPAASPWRAVTKESLPTSKPCNACKTRRSLGLINAAGLNESQLGVVGLMAGVRWD